MLFPELKSHINSFLDLLEDEPSALGGRSAVLTLPKETKEKIRIEKLQKSLKKKKRDWKLSMKQKKVFEEHENIKKKKVKIEDDLKKRDLKIQIEEKSIESEKEAEEKLGLM